MVRARQARSVETRARLLDPAAAVIGTQGLDDRVAPGEHARAGRWRGKNKTECGIHLPIGKWNMNGMDGI